MHSKMSSETCWPFCHKANECGADHTTTTNKVQQNMCELYRWVNARKTHWSCNTLTLTHRYGIYYEILGYTMKYCDISYLPSTNLIYWGWVTHICLGKIIIIGSDNGLSPGRRQAIIWTNAAIFLIGLLGTNFSEILKKIRLKMSSAKCQPFCFGLTVLISGKVDLPIDFCHLNGSYSITRKCQCKKSSE